MRPERPPDRVGRGTTNAAYLDTRKHAELYMHTSALPLLRLLESTIDCDSPTKKP
jgi:hypothetical protein